MSGAWVVGNPLATKSKRFLIRSLAAQDAGQRYVSWWNNPRVQNDLNMPPRGWGEIQAKQHIAQFDNCTRFHLGLFPLEVSLPIGFFTIFADPVVRVALTNVVIGEESWWGQGVPLEVRAHLLPFIFEYLGMEKVKGMIHGRNLPSIFNYEAQGFRCEGILRSEMPGVHGARVDVYEYGLLRDEWRAWRLNQTNHGT
jgi:RimJ/RimL family protein N-acetyltransferase